MTILKLQFVKSILMLLLPIYSSLAYNIGDHVPFFVNKVGPLNNPSEAFGYYELPFCRPERLFEKRRSLGEVLSGQHMSNALYELEFGVNKTDMVICQKKLNHGDVAKFKNAIKQDYYFQMYYDDLPLWAFVGKVEEQSWVSDAKEPNYSLFNHIEFNVLYNENQVIEISAFSDPNHIVDLKGDTDVETQFSYSVTWRGTSTPYKYRMERYTRASLEPAIERARWFSFINWLVMLLLLFGLLTALFKQRLKNDLAKWSVGDEDEEKEVSLKHGSMFTCPTNLPLFSAFVGCGIQLLSMALILSFLATLFPYIHGSLPSALLVTYTLTSAVSGYASASSYSQHYETGWRKSVHLAGLIFSGPIIFISSILNTLAASFRVHNALPIGTLLIILTVFSLISVPLLMLGGSLGYLFSISHPQSSPITKKAPREIPPSTWYRKTPAQMFLGGLIPFAAIYFEFYAFCASLWGHKVYTVNFSLTIAFLILLLIVGLMSVLLTYFGLTSEDQNWHWRSFLCGGSTAIFMLAYCLYYYCTSNMSGNFQACVFLGQSVCVCYAFFLVLGTVSYKASSAFVRWISNAAKND